MTAINGTGAALYGAWVSLGATHESADAGAPRCSAKACRAAATLDLSWRNPGLHDSTRVKHWLSCDEHADHLSDFLGRRGFLLGRGPLEDPAGRGEH